MLYRSTVKVTNWITHYKYKSLIYFRLRHLNLSKNQIYTIPQLMLVEGRHVPTVISSASSRGRKSSARKTPRSARKSRRSERISPDKVKLFKITINTAREIHGDLNEYLLTPVPFFFIFQSISIGPSKSNASSECAAYFQFFNSRLDKSKL